MSEVLFRDFITCPVCEKFEGITIKIKQTESGRNLYVSKCKICKHQLKFIDALKSIDRSMISFKESEPANYVCHEELNGYTKCKYQCNYCKKKYKDYGKT